MLDEHITMELTKAIKRYKDGKTPGLHGLPEELYKDLQNTLSIPILEVFKNYC